MIAPSYKGFRCPQEIIAHVVWLYHRFNLSFRDVEELLAARGVSVTYETVRQWCKKFNQLSVAYRLRRDARSRGELRTHPCSVHREVTFDSEERRLKATTGEMLI